MIILDRKIPPPFIALLIGWWVYWMSGYGKFSLSGWYNIAGAVIMFFGLSIDIACVVRFIRAKTTLNPLNPHQTNCLVTSGFYTLSRNPMYLGQLLMLSVWIVLVGTPVFLPLALVYVFYITVWQIIPEEKILEALFGNEFRAYKTQVRRWI